MSASTNSFAIRPEWLARNVEPALDPRQPIIDAHHHLYDRPALKYLLPDYLSDLNCGHDVRASIFVQARAMLRAYGPEEYRALGETEFVNGVAAMSASGIYGDRRLCAGIAGFADLTLGDAVAPVLERQITAGGGLTRDGGRFCGIRQTLVWDADASLLNPLYPTHKDMVDDSRFRAGFAHLDRLGLNFEAWAFFAQLPDVARLARAFPNVPIVVNHCGGIVRLHGYEHADVHAVWKRGIAEIAACDNVTIKLSGLGMRLGNFGFDDRAEPPTSRDLAEVWRPWVSHCLESFGPSRCMWGSNFPVDKGSYAFGTGLNAMKTLVAGSSGDEAHAVFFRTAVEFYAIQLEQTLAA